MRDKSFYDFLVDNSKLTQQKEIKEENSSQKKVHPVYLLLSWLVLVLVNSFFVWTGWNFVISKIFDLIEVTLFQSVLLYLLCKVILRGFFSAQ